VAIKMPKLAEKSVSNRPKKGLKNATKIYRQREIQPDKKMGHKKGFNFVFKFVQAN